MWSRASQAKPNSKRPRVYFTSNQLYSARGGENYRRVRMVRVCLAACDRGLARRDETVRLGKGRITCVSCAIIGDMLLEAGFSKPLTTRRLTEFLKKRGIDERAFFLQVVQDEKNEKTKP